MSNVNHIPGRNSGRAMERLAPIAAAILALAMCPAYGADITWLGGTETWETGSNWKGGAVPGSSDNAIVKSGTVTLSSDVSVAGFQLSGASAKLTGTGGLTAGALEWSAGTMDGGGATTISGSATLFNKTVSGSTQYVGSSGGARTLNLSGSTTFQSSALSIRYGSTVYNGGTFTSVGEVVGDGTFNDNSINTYSLTNTFSNGGTLVQDSDARTTTVATVFDNTGDVQVRSGTLSLNGGGTASGSFSTLAGGTLKFGGSGDIYNFNSRSGYGGAGALQIVDGTLKLNAGSSYGGTGTLAIVGGTLELNTGGSVTVSTLSMTSSISAKLRGGDMLNVGALEWSTGVMTGGGAITVSGSTLLQDDAGVTSLQYLGNSAQGARTLNLNGDTTFQSNMFSIRYGSIVNNAGTFTSKGEVGTGFTSDSYIESTGGGPNTFNNSGTFVQDSGSYRTTVSPVFNNTGTVQVKSGTLQLNSLTQYRNTSETLTGGTYEISSNATLSVEMGSGKSIVHNAASVTLDGPSAGIVNSTTSEDGLIGFGDNDAAGRFKLKNGATFSSASAFRNAGHVAVGETSTFTVGAGADYTQERGSTRVDGTLAAANVLINAGTLSGGGKIEGNVGNSGKVAPGESPGKMTITGDFSQSPDGELDLEVAGPRQGVGYDWLAIGGSAYLGGTLNVEFIGGYTPRLHKSFDVLTFGGRHGSEFGTVNITGLGSEYHIDTIYTAGGVSLLVAAVPELDIYAMLVAGLGLIGVATRRRGNEA